jgi:hypothetical protein
VRVFGEYAHNLHTWVDFCISFINDPKRCPTTGDKDESGAHVLGHRQFRFDARPDTELLQRRTFNGSTNAGVEVAADFMFWPTPDRKLGWFLEPSYSFSFIGGHEQSLGVSVGLLIPIYAK